MSKRRKYSSEFKQGAVEQTRQPGVSWAQVARELGIGANLLTRWKREADRQGHRLLVVPVSLGTRKWRALTRVQQERAS